MKMYFIAIVLPEEVNKKILVHKHLMQEKFGCRVGLKSPAHITIVSPFWMEEESEERLLSEVGKLSRGFGSVQFATADFSAFKPRTIFIAVEENENLSLIKKAADEFFAQTDYKIKRENRPFHPHITIATRDLHKKAFAEAWPLFQNKKFREECKATGLSVLKHNGTKWEIIYTAEFRN